MKVKLKQIAKNRLFPQPQQNNRGKNVISVKCCIQKVVWNYFFGREIHLQAVHTRPLQTHLPPKRPAHPIPGLCTHCHLLSATTHMFQTHLWGFSGGKKKSLGKHNPNQKLQEKQPYLYKGEHLPTLALPVLPPDLPRHLAMNAKNLGCVRERLFSPPKAP